MCGAVGLALLAWLSLYVAALALSAFASYGLVYTLWLKGKGGAGAVSPLIGWLAVTGHFAITPFLLLDIIALWTPPHFWALALTRTEDYARAGIPMLPVVAGDASTRRHILLHTLILVPLGIAPWALGYAGALYGLTAIVTGAIMLALALQVLGERRPAERASRQLFAFSILYLFLLFAVLLIERGWGGLIARLAV